MGIDLLRNRDYFNIDRPGHYYRRHGATWTDVKTNRASQAAEWLRLIKEHGQLCHLNALRFCECDRAQKTEMGIARVAGNPFTGSEELPTFVRSPKEIVDQSEPLS